MFQYVGLVPLVGTEEPSLEMFNADVPLVLQANTYIDFEKQNRYFEDRQIYRFSARLDEAQEIWLKARLWEQLRRLELSYTFLNQNCAAMVLRLFDSISTTPMTVRQTG